MPDQEKTPTDKRSTLELVLEKLGELSDDTRKALAESREANIMASSNNEMLRRLVGRSSSAPDVLRSVIPYAAVLIALVALVRAW